MAANLGNREKIVIGSIAAILTVLVLHIMVFSKNATIYSSVINERNEARKSVEVLKDYDINNIRKYDDETTKYRNDFVTLMKNFNTNMNEFYTLADEQAAVRQHSIFRNQIAKLMEFRDKNPDIRLNFMEETGWDLPRTLPRNIEAGRENILDIVDKLNQINRALKNLEDRQSVLLIYKEFNDNMKSLGIDTTKLGQVGAFGNYIHLVKLLAHTRLIVEKHPELDEDELLKEFRTDYTGSMYNESRQLGFLIDLLERAKKNKVEEISSVYMLGEVSLQEPPDLEEIAEESTPTPTMTPRGGGQSYYDGYYDGYYYGMGAGGATPTPLQLIGYSVPVELTFKASNPVAIKFLYELTHSPTTYMIDWLQINSESGGNVEVRALIGVMSYAKDMIALEKQFTLE